jgi:YVTN family beta-propeller protein
MGRRLATALLLAGLVLVLGACAEAPVRAPSGPRPGDGRFVLYLNGPPAAPLAVAFELAGMEGVRDDGTRAPIPVRMTRIESVNVVEQQFLVAESFLPPGKYRGLQLRIAQARVRQEGKWVDLAVPAEGFALDVPFEIRRGQATALFMTWDVDRTIEREAFFRPAFAFEGKVQELRRVNAYVTNEESDTVTIIDRSLDRVVGVIEVGRRPRGIAIGPDISRAFVVNSGANTLTIVDVNTNRPLHTTNLELGGSPSDVVVTADGRTLYVSNTALNSVSAIDTSSFQVARTISVGLRPVGLALVPGRPVLLVANTGAGTISVIDTTRNTEITTIPVDPQPATLAVDAPGAFAYVPHLGSPRLAVISLSTLRVLRTVSVGSATAALPDPDSTRVFVAKAGLPRVGLVDVNLSAEIDAVAVGAQPRALALDLDRNKLYVVDQGSDSVTVVDKPTRRVRTTLQVGKRPYGIAIVP